ncbi:4-hydroxy-2-oxovalerate aldolase [Streptomyces sp. DSM 41524]|uniref:Acetaldehyde dehydrogenase n=1 Tax=Streptomyces asiaticus subsp. ignotus TaxID=3098222 RepID=A0ABU7QBZ9_9ACTN|nr:4-hydroxy-2-oxovalerate aldolase [Streptomyces sp. DSM 41524]
MGQQKIPAAIVGPGNIGTDLLAKLAHSQVIDVRYVVGIVESDGLARARGIEASAEGVDWPLRQDPLPQIVFEATSAKAHPASAPRNAEAGIQAVDLTPAHLGPMVSPAVNGADHIASRNISMITCGGQATIPIVHAVSRITPVPYAEIVASIASQAWVGYHGHQNMGLGVANSVIAHQAGVRYIDGSLCALGAGAGNSPTEVLGAVFDRLGVATGLDAGLLLDAAEEAVRPYLSRWPKMDRNAIVQGWAGVYSSFLLHAERAAERYKVPAHAILRRCGERGYVGGQEDMIIDIAIALAEEQTT